jgi:hypothetical protein
MSTTPRTDERAIVWTVSQPRDGREMVSADFAREIERENTAMRAFVEMVALDRDDRASPGLKRQASLMLQDLAAGNFNPDKRR